MLNGISGFHRRCAVLLAIIMLYTVLTPMPPLVVSAQVTDFINLDSSIGINYAKREATQVGTATFNAWTSSGDSVLSGIGADQAFDQLQWVQSTMSVFKDHISFTPSTFDFSSQPIVIELKYKVKLNSYTVAAKPSAKLTLRLPSVIGDFNLTSPAIPTAATQDIWNTVKLVIDAGTQTAYLSQNGDDFIAVPFTAQNATSVSDVRLYTVADPNPSSYVAANDGNAALDTPVTWTFDYIKVYSAPKAEAMPEDGVNYKVKLTNQMTRVGWDSVTSTHGASQIGRLFLNRVNADLTGAVPNGANFDQIKLTMTKVSEWKEYFYLNGADYSTAEYTVMDMKFKFNLSDYSVAEKPKVGLFINNGPENAFAAYAINPYIPAEADQDQWHTVRCVIDNATQQLYISYDGESYRTSNLTVPASSAYAGRFRIYPVAIPSGSYTQSADDGIKALSTPVSFYVDSFTAYQATGTIPGESGGDPVPPTEEVTPKINIDDQISYNPSTFTISEVGMLRFRLASNGSTLAGYEEDGGYFKQLKLTMPNASDWSNSLFYLNGADFSTGKKAVFDLKYKVQLEDYTVAAKPKFGIRLWNNTSSAFQVDNAVALYEPAEADKDTWHTLRFVLDPENATVYWSNDGGAYQSKAMTVPGTATYSNEFRIYPLASPAQAGATSLETKIFLFVDKFTVYEYNGDLPSPTQVPKQTTVDPTPTPPDKPVPPPLSADLAAVVLKSYPQGKMKAAIMSFDDGANWCLESEKKAIAILNKYGLKAAFNIVPGNAYGTFLSEMKTVYAGHEIASHTWSHPYLDQVSDAEFKNQITASKTALETALGSEVPGLVYPYGYSAPTARLNMIKAAGYRYSRAALDSASVEVPESFYNWRPTFHLINSAANPNYIATNKARLEQADASKSMKLLFGWSHSWEFDADTTAGREDTWSDFDAYCEYIADNSATIWNPTPAQYVDYMDASKYLEIEFTENKDVEVYNPSEYSDCWVKVFGINTLVPKGEIVIVKKMEERDFIPSSYLVNIDNAMQYNSNGDGSKSLHQTGAVTYRWAAAADGPLTPIDRIGATSTYDGASITQNITSSYTNHFLFARSATQLTQAAQYTTAKPVVFEARYKLKLDSYTGALPQAELAFSINNVLDSDTISTGKITPSAAAEDTYRTVKFMVDAKTNKVYRCNDNGEWVSVNASVPANISDVRLYTKAYKGAPHAEDVVGTTPLETPITWTFDYFKVYNLEESEAVQIAATRFEKADNTINYFVNARNYDTVVKDGAVSVALYDNSKSVPMLVSFNSTNTATIDATSVSNISGSFDAAGLSDYYIKIFVWNNLAAIMPLATETVSKTEIEQNGS